MKKIVKTITCFSCLLSALMLSSISVAGGNGGGEEPPKSKTRSGTFFCSILPFACTYEPLGGNGGGEEPPKP